MTMGNHDMAHRLTANPVQQRSEVLVVIRTGVHNGNLATPHNETVGAFESEGSGIVASHPPEQGRQLHDSPMARFKIQVECKLVHRPELTVAPAPHPN